MELLRREDLHEYQVYSVDFIKKNPIAALLLSCGLGKTMTTLTAINDLMYDDFEVMKVLVVCPLRVGNVWKQEVEHWKHLHNLRISVAIGNILVWFGLTWSLELYQQTVARLWRQGQTSGTVSNIHILTAGTIDEHILKALQGKKMTQKALIDAVKAEVSAYGGK